MKPSQRDRVLSAAGPEVFAEGCAMMMVGGPPVSCKLNFDLL